MVVIIGLAEILQRLLDSRLSGFLKAKPPKVLVGYGGLGALGQVVPGSSTWNSLCQKCRIVQESLI